MKVRINYNFRFLPVVLFLCLSLPILGAEDFVFKHQKDDRYRILSTVNEDVYINNRLSHKAEILNRIAVEVTGETEDGKGFHKAVFQTSERALNASGPNQSFQWAREYESEFERNRLGRVTIDPKYFMPVVRDVPVFPGKDIKVGETWSHEGHEVHDFRENFGIPEPYKIPFTATYKYLGQRAWKGKNYPTFSVSYKIQSQPPAVRGRIYPRRIQGSSDQVVYWDSAFGQIAAYSEDFRYTFELSNSRKVEWRGKAQAEVVEAQRMEKEKIVEEIVQLEIADVNVEIVDEGIRLTLDDIQFYPDSPKMLPGEERKLDQIIDILMKYKERDIMVAGHTAAVGASGHVELSTARAATVAEYLISKKVRTADRVIVRGYGKDRPIADNATEEGRRKNRRVEITILEN